jgi:Niemann-Pick C1 protein
MAIGLSVDYTVHIAHAFNEAHLHAVAAATPGSHVSTKDSATYALTTMGASVIKGGFTTFLGVLMISGASSVAFRTFFTLIAFTVALGLLHGMVLAPVLLAYGTLASFRGCFFRSR